MADGEAGLVLSKKVKNASTLMATSVISEGGPPAGSPQGHIS